MFNGCSFETGVRAIIGTLAGNFNLGSGYLGLRASPFDECLFTQPDQTLIKYPINETAAG